PSRLPRYIIIPHASLFLSDPAEKVSQHRVAGLANQRAVPGQRGELVDRADREVDRGEVLHQPRSRHRRKNAHAVLETEVRAHVRDRKSKRLNSSYQIISYA